MKATRITYDEVSRFFTYDPVKGTLRYSERPREDFSCLAAYRRHLVVAGTEAAGIVNGYVVVKVGSKTRSGHRVIWALVHGETPADLEIDHINGDRSDNRIENLRLVTTAVNNRNMSRSIRNTSGYPGVSEKDGSFRARINVDGKEIHLGQFKDKDDAIAARKAAEKHFGFIGSHREAVYSTGR